MSCVVYDLSVTDASEQFSLRDSGHTPEGRWAHHALLRLQQLVGHCRADSSAIARLLALHFRRAYPTRKAASLFSLIATGKFRQRLPNPLLSGQLRPTAF